LKFLHCSDLHLGIRVNGFSMMEDQKYILKEILKTVDTEKPDAVLIAGDIYDKSVPPAEAVTLFDDFLYELSIRKLSVFVISGNHDSPERIAFGSRLLDRSGIFLSPVYNGDILPISLKDDYGTVDIFMLPFVKPVNVRCFFENGTEEQTAGQEEEQTEEQTEKQEEKQTENQTEKQEEKQTENQTEKQIAGQTAGLMEGWAGEQTAAEKRIPAEETENKIRTYTDAIRTAVSRMKVNPVNRSVILTHQFVTGAIRSESEDIVVGGTDNVDASVFTPFDYTALGHIHGAQKIGKETVRYCGTPLKYSFSEVKQEKGVTIVEMKEKGDITVRNVPLIPLHDMRKIRGNYLTVTAKDFYRDTKTDDYLYVTLTDEDDIPDAVSKLRSIYPNIMKLDYDNQRTRSGSPIGTAQGVEEKTPLELFSEFYGKQNHQDLDEKQEKLVRNLIGKIWEESV